MHRPNSRDQRLHRLCGRLRRLLRELRRPRELSVLFRRQRRSDRPAAVHHRRQQLQKDEPGTARRIAGRQAASASSAALSISVRSNDILQEYHVDNLAADLSVNGRPGLIWLTKQERIDRDYALFGEASFDVTPQITLTGGGRWYKFDNTVFGFAGFGRNPDFIPGSGR